MHEWISYFNDHVVFSIGILLMTGYFLGKMAEKLHLPAITGYLIAGLVLGESLIGIIHVEMSESLRTVTEVALGIIALTIGCEFSVSKLKRLGKGIVVITFMQMFTTFVLVALGLALIGMGWPFALLLGAIASATAPAATVVIIQSLRARGDYVDTLYGVVALDDAGCVLLFTGVFAFVGGMLGTTGHQLHSLLHAFFEIGGSLVLGLVEGVLIYFFTRRVRRNNEIVISTLGTLFLFTGVAICAKLSPLLMNMMAGAALINLSAKGRQILHLIGPITPPLYAAFFAVAGTELKIHVLASWGVLAAGATYVLMRAMGKYTGVWLGAWMVQTPRRVRDYLGLSMLPQAGVAIGLVLFIQASPLMQLVNPASKQVFMEMANIVLFGVLINELVGPPLSKFAIVRGADL